MVCSTPCGITEVITHTPLPVGELLERCSTPCGITEVITSPRRSTPIRFSCAQRLAASRRSSRHLLASTIRAASCAQRLAASRRSSPAVAYPGGTVAPWCSTPCGITEVITALIEAITTLQGSAQRLAASRRSSRQAPQGDLRRDQVLNALRHHGGHHKSCGSGSLTLMVVLNALRHHGGHHRARSRSRGHSRAACSTPCGITEVITRPGRCDARHLDLVLNALRHHGGHHLTELVETAWIHRGAQRLAASRRSSLRGRGRRP